MAWYWIVLIFVGYLIMTGITAGLIDKDSEGTDKDDLAASIGCGIVWPLFLPIFIGYKIMMK